MKEEYIKQVTKDLPQWLILKQQKEAEDMADFQKAMEVLNESSSTIKEEVEKHSQFMKELHDKVIFQFFLFTKFQQIIYFKFPFLEE